MKKPAPGRKKITSSVKALKSKAKAIGKAIRKIGPKAPKEKLVIKKSFLKIIKDPVSPGTPIFNRPEPAGERTLPAYYSEDKLALLVRDPWWLFAYWEVTPGREAEVMADIFRKGLERENTVLRVHEVADGLSNSPTSFFDIEIHHLNSNWYIDVGRPDREWLAEIGIKTRDGQFFVLVRSNLVKTPPSGISDVLDEDWMMPDEMYFKLLSVIGGFEGTGGSMEIRTLLEKHMRQSASSEVSPKLSTPAPLPKK